jgi:hypothetical protein
MRKRKRLALGQPFLSNVCLRRLPVSAATTAVAATEPAATTVATAEPTTTAVEPSATTHATAVESAAAVNAAAVETSR